jgi:ribosomal protein L32
MAQECSAIKQAHRACPNCGSWYRRGVNCNRCGVEDAVPDSFYDGEKISKAFKLGKESQGMGWDKKAHKVIRKG